MKTLIVFFFYILLFINCKDISGQDSNQKYQKNNKIESTIYVDKQKNIVKDDDIIDKKNCENDKCIEISFTIANWSLAIIALILSFLGLSQVVIYFKDRKNDSLIRKFEIKIEKYKNEIEDIKGNLSHKLEFNLMAAETTFESIEYFTSILIAQDPEIDKDKTFLKKINENKAILFLFHEDREEKIRVLKELKNIGSISIVNTLKKYRDETEDNEIKILADKAIDEILKREGRNQKTK